ncbi:hypothetical protein KKI19_03490 [Patescibacteria group bacterium]|nr:hypothetical protein [Patescibacteria group bacterium]
MKGRRNFRIIGILFVIVVIVILAGVVWLWRNQETRTLLKVPTFKIFTNTNCGYSFEYPDFAKLESVATDVACPGGDEWIQLSYRVEVDESCPDCTKVLPGGIHMQFSHVANKQNLSLYGYLTELSKEEGPNRIDLANLGEVTINGLQGYKYKNDLYWFLIKSKRIILRVGMSPQSDSQLVLRIVNSIKEVD